MIKLLLPEDRPPVPERTVRFEFRRHKQADTTKSVENLAYLVAQDTKAPACDYAYPVKVDGDTKTVEIRRRVFEELGFTVVVKD